MRPQEIIAKKRDGRELSADEIEIFIRGVCDESWADYQISALLMAMFIRGLSDEETQALVRAMLESGKTLNFGELQRPKADKHSTGGVGDKTSLIIAPLAASCGLAVPMISGRGLGHTGGTLDKLESIPGYRVELEGEEFHRIISDCGFAMSGQTKDIAPADRKLYALRDATATVPYVPFIVASIMSKKLSEGLDALVLDVKCGSGAFMKDLESARVLATHLTETGTRFGVATEAIISDMSRPLGRFVGNALEVYEALKILRNEPIEGTETTLELSLALTVGMLALCGSDEATARDLASRRLSSGEALEAFRKNILLQGGDPSVCDNPEMLIDRNLLEIPIRAAKAGKISAIDTAAVGNAVLGLGGGRIRAEDEIDFSVGVLIEATLGDAVAAGDVIGTVFARRQPQAELAAYAVSNAFTIAETLTRDSTPLILERIQNREPVGR